MLFGIKARMTESTLITRMSATLVTLGLVLALVLFTVDTGSCSWMEPVDEARLSDALYREETEKTVIGVCEKHLDSIMGENGWENKADANQLSGSETLYVDVVDGEVVSAAFGSTP